MTVKAGANNYVLTKTRKEWDRDKGNSIVRTYVGPIDKVDDFFDSLINDPDVDKISNISDHGKGMLDVFVADPDPGGIGSVTVENNIKWELLAQDIIKPIRSLGVPAPTDIVFNEAADQEDLESMRLLFESAGEEGIFVAGEPYETYLDLLYRGSSEYVRTAAILRSTLTLSSRSTITASWKGVDRAWKLEGQLGSPDIEFIGAAALIGSIGEMPEADDTKKQWLKRGPQLRTEGKRRFTVTQEWWYARRWSYVLYAGDDEADNP